jgi:hypothetical protein
MSSNSSSHTEEMVLVLVVAGLVIAGVLYALIYFWPYFVFYVLPFVTSSVVLGFVLRWFGTEETEYGTISYKSLAITYPVLLGLVYVVFFAGSSRAYLKDPHSKNVVGVSVDWPDVNDTFNRYRRETYAGSPFDSLKAKVRETSIYDREDLGVIILLALILGAPGLLWYLSWDDNQGLERRINELVDKQTDGMRERIRRKEAELDQIIAKRNEKLQQEIAKLEGHVSRVSAENQVLKAKVEFSTVAPVVSALEKKKSSGDGVLDGDLL